MLALPRGFHSSADREQRQKKTNKNPKTLKLKTLKPKAISCRSHVVVLIPDVACREPGGAAEQQKGVGPLAAAPAGFLWVLEVEGFYSFCRVLKP
jgi:hypothetical protein